jgi:NADPH:quinone reductase-like Zn-dependent oxidoreductase
MAATMKAVVMDKYGPPEVLRLGEAARPVCGDKDVLVRVRAASVNYGDLLARNFKAVTPREFNMHFVLWAFARLAFGLTRPRVRILGSEFAGEVAAVGRDVTGFRPGDPVFGYLGEGMGAYAEYVRVPASGCLARKPANLTFEEAAAVPYGAIMALSLLRRAGIRPGQKVLVVGASGGIGSAAVQIARHFGAEVHGVCAAPRAEYVRALGAVRVIDYRTEDFTGTGETYDLIFDVLGRSSFPRCRRSLAANGRYLAASFKTGKLLRALWTSLGGGQRAICALAPGSPADLLAVKDLVEAGRVRAFVGRSFPLAEAAAAQRCAQEGQVGGKVVIVVDGDPTGKEKSK